MISVAGLPIVHQTRPSMEIGWVHLPCQNGKPVSKVSFHLPVNKIIQNRNLYANCVRINSFPTLTWPTRGGRLVWWNPVGGISDSSLVLRFSSWSKEFVNERLAFLNIAPELPSKYWLKNSCLIKKCTNALVMFHNNSSNFIPIFSCIMNMGHLSCLTMRF